VSNKHIFQTRAGGNAIFHLLTGWPYIQKWYLAGAWLHKLWTATAHCFTTHPIQGCSENLQSLQLQRGPRLQDWRSPIFEISRRTMKRAMNKAAAGL